MDTALPRTAPKIHASVFPLGLGALFLAGIGMVLINTRLGAGLTDDSFYYIQPARDALAGLGFHPATAFSPLLPSALLVLGWLGTEPLAAARYLGAALFGVNIVLVTAIVRQITRSTAAGLLAGLWVLFSENLIDAHSWVMSEPLYFTFLLLAIWSALRFYPKRRTGWLVLAGISAGMACLSRYAGLAVLPGIALALLLDGRARFLRRVGDAALFSALAFLPVGTYFVRNLLVSGLATRYTRYVYVPFLRENLDWYLYNTLSWFVPGRFLHGREVLVAGAGLLLVAAVGTWATLRGMRASRAHTWAAILLVSFVISNFAMLYLARGFQELDVYNTRYLTPVLLVLLSLAVIGGTALSASGSRVMRALLVVAVIAFTGYYALRARDYLGYTGQHGLGYANASWHTSEMAPYVRQNPQLKLVATGNFGIYFWTGNLAAPLNAYGDVSQLHAHLCQSGDTLIIVNSMPTEIYHMSHDQVVQGLEHVKHFNDSEMYRCPAASSSTSS